MRLIVEPMELEDVPEVLEVDRESYTLPWPASAYRREILHNRNARYVVLRRLSDEEQDNVFDSQHDQRPKLPFPFLRWTHRIGEGKPGRRGRIIGYAGMWMMVDEAHITTVAVRNDSRGRGLGELLLASLVERAFDLGARRVTLEVRVSNHTAQRLYRKYGFQQEGVRPRYYSDNNEDAYIMSTGDIRLPAYQRSFEELVAALRRHLTAIGEIDVAAPAFEHQENAEPVQEAE